MLAPNETLEFNAERHEYSVGGRRVPNVTSILDPLSHYEKVPREILERAAEFGRAVHEACFLDDVGRLDEDSLDARLVPYVHGWRNFLRDTGAVVLASETRVFHPRHRYAGTFDALLRWKGRRIIVDRKTTSVVPRSVGPQTAAYVEAYNAARVAALRADPLRYCVQLSAEFDRGYRLHKLDNLSDFSLFVSCLNIYRWNNPE